MDAIDSCNSIGEDNPEGVVNETRIVLDLDKMIFRNTNEPNGTSSCGDSKTAQCATWLMAESF